MKALDRFPFSGHRSISSKPAAFVRVRGSHRRISLGLRLRVAPVGFIEGLFPKMARALA